MDIHPAKGPQNLPKQIDISEIKSNTIWVKNLPYTATECQIKSFFASCGEISNIKMSYSKSKKFKGHCYIDFSDKNSIQSALLLAGQSFEGRFLKIDCVEDTKTADDTSVSTLGVSTGLNQITIKSKNTTNKSIRQAQAENLVESCYSTTTGNMPHIYPSNYLTHASNQSSLYNQNQNQICNNFNASQEMIAYSYAYQYHHFNLLALIDTFFIIFHF